MLNRIAVLLIMPALMACSKYEEVSILDYTNYNDLRPETLITDLVVYNFILEQDEFDDMYLNYLEDINVEAELEIYRNGIKVVEEDEINLEIKGSHQG